MGTFKLGKMTLRSLFGKPATVQYPAEQVPAMSYEHMRGHVVCDMDECILCGMCQRACPVGAIAVNRKEGTWSIDQYRCIQCACCTHECPKSCLDMAKECAPATRELTVTTLRKPEEESAPAAASGSAEAGAPKTARPKPKLTPEQEARVAAARARKAAKDAEKANKDEAER